MSEWRLDIIALIDQRISRSSKGNHRIVVGKCFTTPKYSQFQLDCIHQSTNWRMSMWKDGIRNSIQMLSTNQYLFVRN